MGSSQSTSRPSTYFCRRRLAHGSVVTWKWFPMVGAWKRHTFYTFSTRRGQEEACRHLPNSWIPGDSLGGHVRLSDPQQIGRAKTASAQYRRVCGFARISERVGARCGAWMPIARSGGGGSKTIQNGSLPEIITVIMEVEHMPCAP